MEKPFVDRHNLSTKRKKSPTFIPNVAADIEKDHVGDS
jgi:hypothetical protein